MSTARSWDGDRPDGAQAGEALVTRLAVNLLSLVPDDVGGAEEYAVRTLSAYARHGPADLRPVLCLSEAALGAHPGLGEAFDVEVHPTGGWRRARRVLAEIPARTSHPVAVTVHDLQVLDHPENFSLVKGAYLGWAVPRSVARADVVVAISDAVGHQVVDRLGADPNRVVIVSVGVETAASAPSVPAGPPTVLYPAATYPHKNHCLLVEAFDRVAARHPDARLILTGGQGAAEADVARAIASAEHAGRIDRTGRIPVADLARHLADADVVAFPSTYEGFGIPVLEAMAAGVAILVADGTPAADLAPGCDAVLSADDPAAWAEALDRLLADRDRRTARATRALAAARNYTWEASAAALERAWRLLLDGSVPAGRGM